MTAGPWLELWGDLFTAPPADRTSREVSVQEVMAALIAGHPCDWFAAYTPTERGTAFLEALWRSGFGEAGRVEWFVSEYPLPVPVEWRDEIPYTYRCPDFACGDGDQVLIVELKTERGSYQARQMADYLRLSRHKHPSCSTDVALLAPHLPNAHPGHDERQRYGELTWFQVLPLIAASFAGDPQAEALCRFLAADLAAAPGATSVGRVVAEIPPADSEVVAAVVTHALRMAQSVAHARPGDRVARGIDIELESLDAARRAQSAVSDALDRRGFDATVSVWLWQPSSGGVPSTPAGHAVGRELRLAPKRKASSGN